MFLAQQSVDLVRVGAILAWMAVPVLVGYAAWRWGFRRFARGAAIAAGTTRWLSRCVLLCVSPVLMIVLFWNLKIPLGQALLLPVVGLFAHLFGGGAGYAIARLRGLDRGARGAYFLCGLASNILSFGAIAALFLLGPRHPGGADGALGILFVYRVFETPVYFLFAWPVFAMFAPTPDSGPVGWVSAFRAGFRPVTIAPMAGIVIGCVLNASGAAMGEWVGGLAGPLVKLNTGMVGLIVGITLRVASPRKYLPTCLTVAGIKFILLPVSTVTPAYLLGFRSYSLATVLICSSMPLAMFAVVGAAYYRIEEDRVAAAWIFTTALMPIVVPILAILVAVIV